MKIELERIFNEACAKFDEERCELNRQKDSLTLLASQIDDRKSVLDARESELQARETRLAKQESESNLVQIRTIAANRLAEIRKLKECVKELESQRVKLGNEKALAEQNLAKVKAALPLIRA